MKITRMVNGERMEFRLTDMELDAACKEQKRIYDKSEIFHAIGHLSEGQKNQIDEEVVLNNENLCEKIIETYMENFCDLDFSLWIDAVRKHIFEAIIIVE